MRRYEQEKGRERRMKTMGRRRKRRGGVGGEGGRKRGGGRFKNKKEGKRCVLATLIEQGVADTYL